MATYIPERSVPVDDVDGQPVLTFTADTRPTATQVDSQIADAVVWVSIATGTLDETLYDAARAVAAIRAAGLIELSWPIRDADRNTGRDLLTQADAMLKQLAARNVTLTGEDPDDPDGVFEILPVWSFPAAADWGDTTL